MNNGKRYIFYDTSNGDVIQEEARNRMSIMPTVERVIEIYPKLSERDRSTYDVVILNWVDYLQDFDECSSYRVNLETKQLEFSYPDPNNPDVPQPYQKPLGDQIKDIKIEMARSNTELFETMLMMLGGA